MVRQRGTTLAAVLAMGLLSLAWAPVARAAPAPSPSGAGRLGIQLLEAPVNRRDDPRARVYIVDSVTPGTTISRRLRVTHADETGPGSRIAVTVYPAAASVRDARFQFGAQGQHNQLTSWIGLSRAALTLEPGTGADIEATIAVPRTATAGERYAVIWAQTQARGTGNVHQISRVGIRVYLDVGPGGEEPSNFAIGVIGATRDPAGVPVLTAQVRNTGRRALDLTGTVALANGPGGVRAGPFAVRNGTTLGVGETAAVLARLDRSLPDGPWTATVAVRSGTVGHTVTVRVSFLDQPTVATGVSGPGSGSGSGRGSVPILLVVVAALLGLLALGLAFRARRRAARV
jgi:hypothetical protein